MNFNKLRQQGEKDATDRP